MSIITHMPSSLKILSTVSIIDTKTPIRRHKDTPLANARPSTRLRGTGAAAGLLLPGAAATEIIHCHRAPLPTRRCVRDPPPPRSSFPARGHWRLDSSPRVADSALRAPLPGSSPRELSKVFFIGRNSRKFPKFPFYPQGLIKFDIGQIFPFFPASIQTTQIQPCDNPTL